MDGRVSTIGGTNIHMAQKKKTKETFLNGYIPANVDINPITKESIEQIPPYPDGGVRYAGYAKQLLGDGKYKLLRQETVFTSYQSVASTTEVVLLTVPAKRSFYCTHIQFISDNASTVPTIVRLFDGVNAIANAKWQWAILSNEQFLNHDFTNSPRRFDTSVIIDFDQNTIADYYCINLFGWYEDR